MSGQQKVVVTAARSRVVTVRQDGRVVEIRQRSSPRMAVVSFGVQGPPGALSEEVQQRLEQAEVSAAEALSVAREASASVSALIGDLQGVFTYHAGVISAQGG